MDKLVVKRYAEALFDAAVEMDKLSEFGEQINFVSDVFSDNEELTAIFEHPKLTKADKKNMLDELFKEKVSVEILNLCYIMVDKGRNKYIKYVSEEYNKLSNRKLGIVQAKAITAIPMTDEEKEHLQTTLSNKLNKKIILTNSIDESVVGGVLVEVEGKIIDGSIKGKLHELYKSLNNMNLTKE